MAYVADSLYYACIEGCSIILRHRQLVAVQLWFNGSTGTHSESKIGRPKEMSHRKFLSIVAVIKFKVFATGVFLTEKLWGVIECQYNERARRPIKKILDL